jgi:hypothetical protein
MTDRHIVNTCLKTSLEKLKSECIPESDPSVCSVLLELSNIASVACNCANILASMSIVSENVFLGSLSTLIEALMNSNSQTIKLFEGGKYKDNVREVYLALLSMNVGVKNVEKIVQTVLEFYFYNTSIKSTDISLDLQASSASVI